MRIPRTALAALTGGALLTGALATAASAQEPTTEPAGEHQVVEALCRRIPVVQGRLDDHLARITGDADTAGSVLWLEARADQADGAGRTRLATQLRERADRRAARVEVIQVRLEELDEAAARCAEAGLG